MLGSYLKHLSSVWVAIAFHAHTFVNYEGLINLSGQLLSHHNVPYSGSIGAWYYDNHHEWSRLSIENGGNQLIRECGDPTWVASRQKLLQVARFLFFLRTFLLQKFGQWRQFFFWPVPRCATSPRLTVFNLVCPQVAKSGGGVWARSSLKEGGVPSRLASLAPSQPCRDAA